ncbi:MAG: sigma-70 family RNA polymerase sigma factor [Planctomycetales bacterium]|nr:sigma-70 family RNA polymerase sigma factor [Planctomycetales bacterium]
MARLTENTEGSSGLSLAIRLQQDSAGAWRDLVALYGPLVKSWVHQAGFRQVEAEDIVQDVFLTVHRSIERFDPTVPGATFRGWLWRVTRNAVLQIARKKIPPARGGSTAQAHLAEIADAWTDDGAGDPPSTVRDITALLHRAMGQIEAQVEPLTWDAFVRTVLRGESTEDVARALTMSPSAVRKAKSRTLQRLRKQLGDVL